MKKLLLLPLLFFVFTVNLQAQEENYPDVEGRDFHEKMMNKLTAELSLTADQINKAKSIHQKYQPEIQKLKTEIKPYREKIKSIRDKEKAEFEMILTAEQKQKLQQLKSKFREKMIQNRQNQ